MVIRFKYKSNLNLNGFNFFNPKWGNKINVKHSLFISKMIS